MEAREEGMPVWQAEEKKRKNFNPKTGRILFLRACFLMPIFALPLAVAPLASGKAILFLAAFY